MQGHDPRSVLYTLADKFFFVKGRKGGRPYYLYQNKPFNNFEPKASTVIKVEIHQPIFIVKIL
jgi:hypothetical protein